MRRPNQPEPEVIADAFCDLAPDQIAKIALLAVRVSFELGKDNVWGAWELLNFAKLEPEEKSTLWLMFDSSQRSAIRGIKDGYTTSQSRKSG